MTIGTTRFVGARLREAREARGVSAASLADMLDITRAAISQYECGQTSPSPDVMERITRILDLPARFFLTPVFSEGEHSTIFYRSMHAATKAARVRAERRYDWLRRIVLWLSAYVQLQRVNFPQINVPDDIRRISDGDIEEIAAQARKHWRLDNGPLLSAVGLLEHAGAIVVRMELNAETLDAFSEWHPEDQRPYLVLGSDKASAVRSRYDACHELGHMLLHRLVPSEALRNTATFRLVEDQAHRFAGSFLLPEASFSDDLALVTIDTFLSLKSKWQVSVAAMLKRATDLNLVAPDHARKLWMNLTRRGWRRREPLDERLEAEEPRFIRNTFDLLIEQHIVTPLQLEAHLGLRTRDIEQVCGLAPGYLDQGPHAIRLPQRA